jgi:hypothetical protein
VEAIKRIGGFGREDKARFDGALTDLQSGMYLTMCGKSRKVSKKGEEYGWSSTVFCTTEAFFGDSVFQEAAKLSQSEAEAQITERVLELNPAAEKKKIAKFIRG